MIRNEYNSYTTFVRIKNKSCYYIGINLFFQHHYMIIRIYTISYSKEYFKTKIKNVNKNPNLFFIIP